MFRAISARTLGLTRRGSLRPVGADTTVALFCLMGGKTPNLVMNLPHFLKHMDVNYFAEMSTNT